MISNCRPRFTIVKLLFYNFHQNFIYKSCLHKMYLYFSIVLFMHRRPASY